MASMTATLTHSPAVEPTTTATLTLANVLYEKKGAIAYVTVNRPKVLNALNTPTWKDLRTAFEDARDDTAVRGVWPCCRGVHCPRLSNLFSHLYAHRYRPCPRRPRTL